MNPLLDKTVTVEGKTYKLSKVHSVTAVGRKSVFDLEVKDAHCYYANNILVHNCSYHEMLQHSSKKVGAELLKFNDTFVLYRHRALTFYPSGPDERTLRGRTRCESAMDEVGWFDNSPNSTKVKIGASGVYDALARSLRTVRSAAVELWEKGFTEVPTGMFFNISSPSSARDKIMELVRKAQGSIYTLGMKRATWEMNPKVTRKHLADEFQKNPITAMRDYGAEPPLTSNALLSRSQVEKGIGKKSNAVLLQHYSKKSSNGEITRYAKILKARDSDIPSVLTIDAGVTNNSFAFTLAHLKEQKFPVIDAVGEIQPAPGMRLNFNKIFKHVLVPLLDVRNVQLVAADRWNSEKILSDLKEDHEVNTRMYSLKYADMMLFKDYLEDSKIMLPKPGRSLEDVVKYDQSQYPSCFKNDAIGHFYLQLLTVQDTGASVIKGDQLTDDMVRSSMLALRMLLDEDYKDLWLNDRKSAPKYSIQDLVVSRKYSGGSSSRRASSNNLVSSNGGAIGISKMFSKGKGR